MPFPPDPDSPSFFVFFIAMWLGVTGFLSTLSGWCNFARRWQGEDSEPYERFRMRSGSLGFRYFPVSYGNCLTITVSERGLGLSIFFLFRFMSPPLFIPWSNIQSVTEGKFLFVRHVVVQPTGHWARVKLYGAVAQQVLTKSRGRIRSAA